MAFLVYIVCHSLSFLILKFFFGLEVKGRENIPKKGGFILASNHASFLDPMALGVGCPRRLNYLAKQDLFKGGLSSWFYYSLGAFPIKRDSADLSALKEAIRRVRSGKGLILFPQGTRKEAGLADEPHAGIGFLAAKLNVPVIPAFVSGTDKALPKGARFACRSKVYVNFGREIQLDKGLTYQEIARIIMENIRALSKGEN